MTKPMPTRTVDVCGGPRSACERTSTRMVTYGCRCHRIRERCCGHHSALGRVGAVAYECRQCWHELVVTANHPIPRQCWLCKRTRSVVETTISRRLQLVCAVGSGCDPAHTRQTAGTLYPGQVVRRARSDQSYREVLRVDPDRDTVRIWYDIYDREDVRGSAPYLVAIL